MPRQTKHTALPKSPAPATDWVHIRDSGRVWEFIEGEDFTGKASSFRARAKTAARKLGVDFKSVEVQRDGRTVLKILAFPIEPKRRVSAAPASSASGVPSGANPSEELRLIP